MVTKPSLWIQLETLQITCDNNYGEGACVINFHHDNNVNGNDDDDDDNENDDNGNKHDYNDDNDVENDDNGDKRDDRMRGFLSRVN